MKPFNTHTGIVATLDRANVDTDAIIPKQFLKSIKRTGYGPNAFFDWRYLSTGEPDPDFELNHPRFENRSVLITRNNFGCGSSREHAVWALVQDGFRVIIAPRKEYEGKCLPAFADIFRINATKNGLLTIDLPEEDVNQMFTLVKDHSGLRAVVDLTHQQIVFQTSSEPTFQFETEAAARDQLLKGRDDIAQTLQYEADIARFQAGHSTLSARWHTPVK